MMVRRLNRMALLDISLHCFVDVDGNRVGCNDESLSSSSASLATEPSGLVFLGWFVYLNSRDRCK